MYNSIYFQRGGGERSNPLTVNLPKGGVAV